MASESYWIEVLIGVYKHLRAQQEIIRHLSVSLHTTLSFLNTTVPGFGKQFEQNYEATMRGEVGRAQTAVLEAIDLSIAELQARPKSPN